MTPDDAWEDLIGAVAAQTAQPRAYVRTILSAALSSLEESGWVLVPKEATDEMLRAPRGFSARWTSDQRAIYAALIAARPTFPPQET